MVFVSSFWGVSRKENEVVQGVSSFAQTTPQGKMET